MMVTLLGLFGWRITWGIVAGLIAFGFLPLARWLLNATTRDLSLDQQVPQPVISEVSEQDEPAAVEAKQWTRGEVARDIRFWLILPAVMSSPYLLTGMFFHQASLGQEYGLSLEVIAGFFTSFAIAAMLGSLIIGPVVDRRGYLTLFPICYFLMGLAIFILSQSGGLLGAWVFYALSGFAIGLVIPVSGALWPGLYGVRHLGSIRSMLSSITVLATGLAPASYGYMLDAGVTLKQIAFWGAIYSFATVSLLVVFVLLERARRSALEV
jgi:MFS family permease